MKICIFEMRNLVELASRGGSLCLGALGYVSEASDLECTGVNLGLKAYKPTILPVICISSSIHLQAIALMFPPS